MNKFFTYVKGYVENFVYYIGGNWVTQDSLEEMEYISKYLPQELQGCDTMLDLGCGDGVNTLRIKDILKIKEVIGYDKNKNLIARARRRGIEAYQLDIEEVPDEFWHKYKEKRICCTLWGVLHHLASPYQTLKRLSSIFSHFFIRERISKAFLELGKPFSKDEFIRLIKDCLPSASLIEYKKVSGKKVLFAIQ